jgi:hypothetical protein
MEHDCGESSTALLDKVAAARERFAVEIGAVLALEKH